MCNLSLHVGPPRRRCGCMNQVPLFWFANPVRWVLLARPVSVRHVRPPNWPPVLFVRHSIWTLTPSSFGFAHWWLVLMCVVRFGWRPWHDTGWVSTSPYPGWAVCLGVTNRSDLVGVSFASSVRPIAIDEVWVVPSSSPVRLPCWGHGVSTSYDLPLMPWCRF